jgi:tetratricopeptide (TPR) repeat protein
MASTAPKQHPPAHKRAADSSQALQRALQLHQQGKLDQAEYMYRAIPPTQPGHPDALHLLGILKYQQGQNVEALRCIGSAVKAQATNFQAWSTLGLVHSSLRQPEQALIHYNKALALKPDYPEALNNRGNALIELNRPREALASYDSALAARPDYLDALNNRANVLRDLKRPTEALASYDRALTIKPDNAEALNNRGNALRDVGDSAQALASFDRALAIRRNFVEALYNRGNALVDLRRMEEALASFEQALSLKPDLVEALTNQGGVLLQLRRPREALESCDRALALRPNDLVALENRGNALRDLGRPSEALASYDRAIEIKADYPEALNQRGNALRDLRRPLEAMGSYERAIALRADFVEAHNNRGNALADLRRPIEALESYNRALAGNPDHPEALTNRANVLKDLKRPAEALASCDRALALRPDYVEALNSRGNALTDLKRPEEALASYDRALAIDSRHAVAHDNKGIVLSELGRFEEARLSTLRAIELAPRRIRSYYNLAEFSKLSSDDPHLRAMQELARDMTSLTPDEQVELSFALGKAFGDIGDRERAFRRLQNGNELKRQQTCYDEAACLAAFARTQAAFTPELMHKNEGAGDPSRAPVFILGMPRSGTTLVEQILASHPKVFGAGEIDDFGKAAVGALKGAQGGARGYPEAVSQMSGEQLRTLGAAYVERIGAVAPAAARIVNKTPENFRLVGLIHLALPNARIIHVRRDPVDTCFSCFSKLFVDNMPYAYNLEELGRYYRAYEDLMAHWRAILPPGVMIDVQYEEVVADLEGQTRRILSHCDVEWDARCLDFHRTARSVRTASVAQVRQPIYQSSIGRWRAYESFLAPLISALGAGAGGGAPGACD